MPYCAWPGGLDDGDLIVAIIMGWRIAGVWWPQEQHAGIRCRASSFRGSFIGIAGIDTICYEIPYHCRHVNSEAA
jgi:hypothetical protein